MKRDFESIINKLEVTNAGYDWFVDFKKVYKNVNDVLVPLNILNSLVNREDFDENFIDLIHKYPEVLKAIPILLAVREEKIYVLDETTKTFYFDFLKNTDQEYLDFLKKTGLKDLLTKGRIKNLVDYVTGVEVGLDTNARKNRTGEAMEKLVKLYLKENIGEENFLYQETKIKISEKYNIPELNKLEVKNKGKDADKKFDFAFKYQDCVYLVEANFYNKGGSKLNEVARSYEKLADEINNETKIKFIWITDGQGWLTAKNNLEESYEHQEYLFTIDDLRNNSLEELLSKNKKKE